jgi:3D (Asp-Asp-Asp) domain-containing protein
MPRSVARRLGRVCCLLLIAIAAITVARADDHRFDLPPAKVTGLQKRAVRLSEYSIVFAEPGDAISLLDPDEQPLGVKLSRDDFCTASLQGMVQISGVRYSVAGKGPTSLVDCAAPRYDCPRCAAFGLGQNRFLRVDHPEGLAGKTYGLIAYRTVAVKDGTLAPGTVLFIPAARGLRLPNGSKHDGYFFVADAGQLNGNQIDIYSGSHRLTWWIIGSGRSGKTLAAYVVTDRTVIDRMKAEHIAAAKALAPD